jgi:hypothetical protein
MRRSSACWGQTQHRSILGSLPTTSPTSPSRQAEPSHFLGGEFMERYTTMYPHGQPGLSDDPVTAYVNNCARPAPPPALRRHRASAASLSHRRPTTGMTRRARASPAPARRSAGHPSPGAGAGSGAPRLTAYTDGPVQEQPHEGNGVDGEFPST